MIARLRGTLLERSEGGAVIDAGGVGYAVILSEGAANRLPPLGDDVELFIVESVAMYGGGTSLYGFLTEEERKIFNVLRENVPNTGAKKALDILEKATKSLPDFRRAVIDKDPQALVSLFGFTAKTAEKLVPALQGKLEGLPLAGAPSRRDGPLEDAVAGLVALGYRDVAAREAAQSAQATLGAAGSSQALIRESLQRLSARN